MKKKGLSIFVIAVLLMSLVAFSGCSSDGASGSKGGDEGLTIKFSTTFQENETGGVILKHFIDKIDELSDGTIDVNMSWGGTLFPTDDELDAIMDGSVDMIDLGHMPHINTLTYLSFPGFAPGDVETALNYFNTLMFEDPETSALIQGEAEELGIKYLNVVAGGANAFCSKNEFSDLDALVKKSSAFGNMDAAIFEELGFQVTSLFPPDIYDALNRGLIDSTQMALTPMVAMSWFEPAPYWALDGTYTAGNFFTVNLDWWNNLTEEQRNIIQEAADEIQDISITLYNEAISEDLQIVEEKTGNKFIELQEEDIDRIWAAIFEAKVSSSLELAENADKVEGMEVILKKAAEITNYDWKN